MPLWLKVILQMLFIVIVFVIVYNVLKVKVLSKLHPNKWLILGLAVLSFFVPIFLEGYFKYNINGTIWQYVQSAFFIVFFLWFIDLRSGAIYNTHGRNQNNKKDVTIKPKAKPRRVQNNKNKKS